MSHGPPDPKLGRNPDIEYHLRRLNIQNISGLASKLQQDRSAFTKDEIAKVWAEAVLIEIAKNGLLATFGGTSK